MGEKVSRDSGWCLEGRRMGKSITPRGAVCSCQCREVCPVVEARYLVGWFGNDSFSEAGYGEKSVLL